MSEKLTWRVEILKLVYLKVIIFFVNASFFVGAGIVTILLR